MREELCHPIFIELIKRSPKAVIIQIFPTQVVSYEVTWFILEELFREI
jgi:hypothetical protein